MLALSYEAPIIWINLNITQVPVIEIKQLKFVMCQKKKKSCDKAVAHMNSEL